MSYPKKHISDHEKNVIVDGTLYLVATPIGNLADLSERALKVLTEVDFVAAEDTRNTGLLLSRCGIPSKPMISYYEHNKRQRGQIIADKLLAGESCALVSDAGTPAISDPGEDLVRLCHEQNIPVCPIPGCCAAISALTVSGLSTGRFAFEGFITTAKSLRRDRLVELSSEVRTMIFYEAPHKLKATLADLFEYFGDRKLTLCRELTKLNEDICVTTIADAVAMYGEREPRGEYVLVVEGAAPRVQEADYPDLPEEHVAMLEADGMEHMNAIKAAAKARGLSKGDFYKLLLDDKS